MERAATSIAGLKGVRRASLAVLAGAASVLAFAPVHAWPVLFGTFGILLWLLDGCYAAHQDLRSRLTAAALIGFWFGFGYFLAGLYWVAEAFLVEPWRHGWLLPFVMTILPGGMALYFAAACAAAMLLWAPGAARIFALAAAIGIAEFVRGHLLTGLPWNLVGYGLTANLPMMQLAALFGVYALSLLAVLVFASPASIFAPQGSGLARRGQGLIFCCAALLLLAIGALWGERRLGSDPAVTDIRVRIVQANVDQANKWRAENSEEIFSDYLTLTTSGVGLAGIDLVVWPETAVPFLLGDSTEALRLIGDALPRGTALLAGSARLVEERDSHGGLRSRKLFNSLLVIDDEGEVASHYDKIHLVPFGEYLPFQNFLESLGIMQLTGVRGGFSDGEGPRLLEIPGAQPVSPLICYEIIFPDDVTDPDRRPGWLLNLTNDAWFGSSAGPYQHFHQARVRAVEQGLPVVRAANTGISAIIDGKGRVRAELALGKEGVLNAGLPKALPPTPFARFERIIEIAALVFVLLGWLAFRRRQRFVA
jgi:apolipoprotein N-acyltransferase